MAADKLPPPRACPFCSMVPIMYHTRMSSHTYSVLCVGCGATGPSFTLPDIGKIGMTLEDYERKLRRQAIDAWNKRA